MHFRNVLAAATPYFHAMFTSGLIESEFSSGRWSRGAGTQGAARTRQRLVLQGIRKSTLEALVDFVYSGEIALNRDNVQVDMISSQSDLLTFFSIQDILISADMIELSDVVSRCTEFLKCELHESNAIGNL